MTFLWYIFPDENIYENLVMYIVIEAYIFKRKNVVHTILS